MATRTIKYYGGDLDTETISVRCDLLRAEAPVEVDYGTGDGWQPTQWQCADARYTRQGLGDIGRRIAAESVGVPVESIVVYIYSEDDREATVLSNMAATWDRSQGVYICGDWISPDGYNWTDRDGQDVEGPEFDAAAIRLDGGPKSGVIVR